MNLYIKIENNQPVDYPIVEDNLRMLGIDINNLPNTYAVYNKVDAPSIGPYEKLSMDLALNSGVVTEVYHVLNMTEEERLAKFDEATCCFVPPTPKPEGAYIWDNESEQWTGMPGI
jgi:hypothetical protein